MEISKFHDFLIFQGLEPRISSFYYTKTLQKNQKKNKEHPRKILSVEIWDSKTSVILDLSHLAT